MERAERSDRDVERAVERYGDMLLRICFVMLGGRADAEDAVQETFIRYMLRAPAFSDGEHERAWLITAAKNRCRDVLRARRRHPQVDVEQLAETPAEAADSGILEALASLPERFRLVLTLYYVQQLPVGDIARVIRRTPSAVKMRLQKGRRLLEETYRKEYM